MPHILSSGHGRPYMNAHKNMVDVDSFLQNGYWQNSRASKPQDATQLVQDSGVSSSRHTAPDQDAPRRLPYHTQRPRYRPPPPSVEDEVESLAKEHGSVVSAATDEEPISRGDPEQTPILLEVHEHNPERRFVLVPNGPESPTRPSSSPRKESSRRPQFSEDRTNASKQPYEANTARKYDVPPSEPKSPGPKPERERNGDRPRSRHNDLPPLATDPYHNAPNQRSPRSRSSIARDGELDGYQSSRQSSRIPTETISSPDVIVNGANGRDRLYRGNDASDRRDRQENNDDAYARSTANDRRYRTSNLRQGQSTSPVHEKRQSMYDLSRDSGREARDAYEKTRLYPEVPVHKIDPSAVKDSPPRRSTGTRDRRGSPPYEDRHSSDEESRRRLDARRRRTSFTRDDRNDSADSPMGPRPIMDQRKPRSKASTSSPLPPPRTSSTTQLTDKDRLSGPRTATFPRESRGSGDDDRSERSLSRSSTSRPMTSSATSIAVPAVLAAATAAAVDSGTPADPRKSAIPPPPQPTSARSSSTTLSSSPPKHGWQPPKFEPPSAMKPITSYRRFSEEVKMGELPDIPECPRTRPVAGMVDWLTLPRTDNFNICPTCYQASFGKSEFAHLFVPAPFRSLDRPLACDFGTSRWSHLGWLFTHKYRKTDLAILHNISRVAAKNQPCNGFQEMNRNWLSIRDPRSRRTMPNFKVCHHCAQIVEVLLPNLTGIFVPVDNSNGPTLGVCDMHPQGERRRFVMYFDALEGASDLALTTQRAPDIQAIADRIGELSAIPECRGSLPIHNASWHTMRSIPELTVCDECFHEVVLPCLEMDYRDPSPVAGNFLERKQRLPVAACHLHSHRMRDIFARANRHRDLAWLETKFHERMAREQDYHAKVVELGRQAPNAPWIPDEVEKLTTEWKRWE